MDNSSASHVLFLLWFFAATFSFCKGSSNISCNEKEKQALLIFKRGLTNSGNTLSSWSDPEDCCIRELHLGNHSLHGEISHFLLELEYLNYLDLRFSNFNCTRIPSFLGSMASLKHLALSRVCGLIPHQLGNLSGLHHLDFGFSPSLYVDSLHWMSSLSSMKYLDMSFVDLHAAPDWLQIMSRLPSLSELHLQDCNLESLNPSLGFVNFTSLLVLDLSSNSLKGEIPHGISNFQKLEILALGENHLTGNIPESIGQLKHLTVLDLQINSFSGPIPSSLGNLSFMWGLILYDNQLNGTFPKSLALLSNLKFLAIGNNYLTGNLDEVFFTKFSKLKVLDVSQTSLFFNVNSNWVPPFQLEFADMSFCKRGPNFPEWLKTQRSLETLLMPMSGILGKAPSWFWNWTSNVDIIDLSGNNIEGDVSDILPNSRILNLKSNHLKGQLPHLSANVEVLNIANNSFSGSISTFLCHKVNRRNKLQVLDASNNLLSGKLSYCWKYWQSLIYLNLGSNNLSGRIPYSMVSLVGIKALRLHNNSISGDIPSSLQKCSNLTLIDIGENHFPMTIPLWIGKMPSLQILRLRSSGAMAMLPDYAYGVNLEYFNDVSPYFVSLMLVSKGNVLEYEGNLRFVKIIDLSSNNLSGSIPVEISFLSKLNFLNLSRNHLTGNIPEKIGTMKELESIDLSRNHLSGEIPPSMSNLTFLSYLDLSYNNFSGRIPSSTQLQGFDALSYAGNPELCGAPLRKNCTKKQKSDGDTPLGKTEDESETSWFYIGSGVGFALGFWGVCGALFLKKSWRHAYFQFVYDMKDQAYVTTVLKVNWICKKFKKLTFW
ncbi:hypothetical protein ACB098_12G060900 [Castanea mollissima]